MADGSIEGKTFCVAGIVMHYGSHHEAEEAIVAAGGKVSKSIGVKTDVLVLGTNTSSQEQKARSRGIPIITERQLVRLLAGEDIPIERAVKHVGDAPLEALIGEARAILDGHPNSNMWVKVLALVDSCAPEQLEALVDFLEPQVTRWAFAYDTCWPVDSSTYGCALAPNRWMQLMPLGELRVAPYQWVVDMAAGEDSPKYRLVHAIHTRDMGLNGTMLGTILSCPNLTNLRDFDVDENKVSKTLFKKLRTAPSTRTLEHLRISRLDEKSVAGIEGDHHLTSLRRLTVRMDFATKTPALHELLKARACEHVETLHVEPYYLGNALSGLTGPDILPNLRTLSISSNQEDELRQALVHPVVTRVERVLLDTYWHIFTGKLQSITDGADTLRHLDLSRMGTSGGQWPDDPSHVSALVDAISRWTPPANLETLTLGHWYTDELASSLTARLNIEVLR